MVLSKEQLKGVLADQRQALLRKNFGVERTALKRLEELKKLPHAVIITGLRRCGKSTLMRQAIKNFYSDEDFYYITFEDERMAGFEAKHFNDAYEALVELYGVKKTFFIDEIQNVDGFEAFVRRFSDDGFKFYISGSNAKLLSKELGTKLTGRHVDLHLGPFSFKEFLELKNASFDKTSAYQTQERALLKNFFEEYLIKGGMPEFISYNDQEVLARVYDDIVIKDIAVRHGVENTAQLKELYSLLITNFSTKFSLNSLKKTLDFGSVNTIKKFVSYLEETHFGKVVAKFDYSLKKQLVNEKKFYVADNAFLPVLAAKFTPDKGRLLENLVFNSFPSDVTAYYYAGVDTECDFVLVQNNQVQSAIQVCYELNDANKQRETKGLLECVEKLGAKTSLILTYDQQEELRVKEKTIEVKPVWKWLLEEKK